VLSLSDPVQGLSEDRQRTSGLKHPTHPVRAVATLPVLRWEPGIEESWHASLAECPLASQRY